jgi:hypothetical protein
MIIESVNILLILSAVKTLLIEQTHHSEEAYKERKWQEDECDPA